MAEYTLSHFFMDKIDLIYQFYMIRFTFFNGLHKLMYKTLDII